MVTKATGVNASGQRVDLLNPSVAIKANSQQPINTAKMPQTPIAVGPGKKYPKFSKVSTVSKAGKAGKVSKMGVGPGSPPDSGVVGDTELSYRSKMKKKAR
jgi:hypothetical protein